MKQILLSLAAATLLFSSCHKDDDGDYVSNTWSVNGVVHRVVNSGRLIGNTNIFVNDGNTTAGSSLTFFFAGAPVSGTYTIVDFPTQPKEVGVLAQEGSLTNLFRSAGVEGETRTVMVQVDGGRATIYMQGATLQSVIPGAGAAEITASIQENN